MKYNLFYKTILSSRIILDNDKKMFSSGRWIIIKHAILNDGFYEDEFYHIIERKD